MRKIKKNLGLILAEVLVTVAIVGVASVILVSIVSTAYSTTTMSKNYLIAQNLATESAEAVKSLRDSNWLLKPDDMGCWMRKDIALNCPSLAVVGKSYTTTQNLNNQWVLSNESLLDLDLDVGAEDNYVTFRLYKKDGKYTHNATGATETNFYRSVKFSNVTNDSATFEVKVQWKEGAKVRKISRTISLHNYF